MDKPERIYNWQNSQLSIARHYGGCRYNGAEYIIAFEEDGQPLVRADILKGEQRRKRAVAVKPEQIDVFGETEGGGDDDSD